MVSQKEFVELTNELKNLKYYCGEKEWENLFVKNPDFKEDIDNLIKFYKKNPDSYKAEILWYLGLWDLAEPKATHPDLFDPEKINI
jgi:hypothetical protein